MTTRFPPGIALVALALALSVAGCGRAESVGTAAEVALYGGPDRLQKLVEGAKKEGELTIYTSAQSNDLGAVVAAYEKKYGI